jgi:hypothetical protein
VLSQVLNLQLNLHANLRGDHLFNLAADRQDGRLFALPMIRQVNQLLSRRCNHHKSPQFSLRGDHLPNPVLDPHCNRQVAQAVNQQAAQPCSRLLNRLNNRHVNRRKSHLVNPALGRRCNLHAVQAINQQKIQLLNQRESQLANLEFGNGFRAPVHQRGSLPVHAVMGVAYAFEMLVRAPFRLPQWARSGKGHIDFRVLDSHTLPEQNHRARQTHYRSASVCSSSLFFDRSGLASRRLQDMDFTDLLDAQGLLLSDS